MAIYFTLAQRVLFGCGLDFVVTSIFNIYRCLSNDINSLVNGHKESIYQIFAPGLSFCNLNFELSIFSFCMRVWMWGQILFSDIT